MVLLVMGLLLGGILGPLSIRQEVNKRQDTEIMLQTIHDTLMGFAITHGYLPCPDANGDGQEERTNHRCHPIKDHHEIAIGQLPYVTLGVGYLDPWNNRFTYTVDPDFADSSQTPLPTFTSINPGRITVTHGIDHTPALVISHGNNGLGAVNAANKPQWTPESPSERENSDHNALFIRDEYRDTPENTFDDMMTWISPPLLALRMLQAGKPLP
ncbi:MAG: hypothetical protein H7829_15120 [Magnetococcus sp. THC-1_WYH]